MPSEDYLRGQFWNTQHEIDRLEADLAPLRERRAELAAQEGELRGRIAALDATIQSEETPLREMRQALLNHALALGQKVGPPPEEWVARHPMRAPGSVRDGGVDQAGDGGDKAHTPRRGRRAAGDEGG